MKMILVRRSNIEILPKQTCFEVQVVGTTGYGDSTVAGFLAAIINGLSPMDSVTFALGIGASNVETLDDLSGVRSWDETWKRIHSGWKRKPNINS